MKKYFNFFLIATSLFFIFHSKSVQANSLVPECIEIGNKKYLRFSVRYSDFYNGIVQARLSETSCEKKESIYHQISQIFTGKRIVIGKTTREVFGFKLPEFLLDRIQLALKGVKSLDLTSKNPDDIGLELYQKGVKIDHKMNLLLSTLYGAGPATEIYSAWLRSHPGHQNSYNLVTQLFTDMNKLSNEDLKSLLNKLFPNTVLFVNPGIGGDLYNPILSPSYGRVWMAALQSIGLPLIIAQKDPNGSLEDNTRKVQEQLEKILLNGHNVIILSYSKGSPEALSALTRLLNPELLENANQSDLKSGAGKVIASLQISPMLTGSFIVQKLFGRRFLERLAINLKNINSIASKNKFLKEKLAALQFWLEYAERAVSLSNRQVEDFVSQWKEFLPQDINYLTLNFAPFNDGLIDSKSELSLLQKVIRFLKMPKQANDGTLELPSMLLENSKINSITHLFDGSHMVVLDSTVANQKLSDSDIAARLFAAGLIEPAYRDRERMGTFKMILSKFLNEIQSSKKACSYQFEN